MKKARPRRSASEYLELAMRAINEGVYDWDVANGKIYYSQGVYSVLGMPRDMKTPADWRKRIHPDDLPAYDAAILAHFKRKARRFACDYRFRATDGTWRWARQQGIAQRDRRGRAIRMIGAIGDITEFKQAEEARRQSDERYAFAMRAINEGVYDWNIAEGKTYYSARVVDALGLTHRQLRSAADWYKRLHPEDRPRYDAAMVAHFKGKTERFECDFRYRARDGEWRWARQHGIAVRDARGRAVRVVGSTGDITEWKRVEQALGESEQRYALATRAATEGIYEWNLETGLLYLSDRAKAFFAVEGDALTPATWNRRIHGEDFQDYRNAIVDYFKRRGKTFEHEYRIRNAAGGYSWVVDRAAAVRNAEGRVIRLVGALSDITLRKRHEDELRGARDAATESLDQQTATAEVLRVIVKSQTDVRPVFDAIADHAARLCDAVFVGMFRYDGEQVHFVAQHNLPAALLKMFTKDYPRALDNSRATSRAIATRSIVEVRDVLDDPNYSRQLARVGGWRRTIAVPFLRGDQVLGVIAAGWREPGPVPQRQLALLQTFADQAVIAIENVRLFNETRSGLARQTATAEILKVIGASMTDTKPVFEAIVKSCHALFERGGVSLRLIRGGALEAQANIGEASASVPIDRRSPVGVCVLEKRVIHLPDFRAATKRFPHLLRAGLKHGFRCGVFAPLLREGRAIGSITVRRREPRAFTDEDVELLRTFADQAVIAIENVRLFKELEARNKDLGESLEQQTASAEILRVISSSPTDVKPVFEAIVKSAMRITGTDDVTLMLVDGKVVKRALHHGPIKTIAPGEVIPIDRDSLVGRVVLDRRTIHIRDVLQLSKAKFPRARAFARRFGLRTALGVPLLREGRAIGVLGLRRREMRPFTDRQVAMIEAFASQAVIAIENVRLFNETKEALERQTATAEILEVIARSPSDVQPVLDAVVERARLLLGGHSAAMTRIAGEMLALAAHTSTGKAGDAALKAFFPVTIAKAYMHGPAIRTRAPFLIDDTDRLRSARALGRARGYRSSVSVPLLLGGKAIGTLAVTRTEAGRFTPHQVELLSTFARQAVIAIENVRLFNETKEALERQTATAEILKVIASSPSDVKPVFDAIAASAQRLLGGHSSSVRRVFGELLHLEAYTSTSKTGDEALKARYPRPLHESPNVAKVIRTGLPQYVEDTESYPEFSGPNRETARARGYRSFITVPLLQGDTVLGAITVTRQETGGFREHHVALLKTFADQAVIAIENVRLFNETKEALERQTATAEILKVIARSPSDVQPVFDAIARSAVSLCSSLYANVFRYDGELIHFAASHQVEPGLLEKLKHGYPRRPDNSRANSRAILTRAPVRIENAKLDATLAPPAAVAGEWRRILSVPMLREGEPIGAISVGWTDPGPILPAQEDLLKTFADQAVIAIENVRLFNETREALERQTATAEILRVIAGSPSNVQPVFDAIADSAKRLLNGHAAVVGRRIGDMLHLAAYTSTGEAGDAALKKMLPAKLTGQGHSGKAILTAAPVWVSDVDTDPDYSEAFRATARMRGFRSVVSVPMLREGEAIGVISVYRAAPGKFSDHQTNLLKTFADQAVIAIENVRLFNETKEALERQTATAEILRVIAGSPSDVKPVFDAIAASAHRLLGGLFTVVARREGESLHLAAHTAASATGDRLLQGLFPARITGEGAMGKAVLAGAPVCVDDIETDPAYSEGFRKGARKLGMRSMVNVPMLREGESIGVISVSLARAGSIGEHQTNLLKAFADQAVIAIENVRLFNETKESLERQTATAEVLQVIAASPSDVQPVFEAILHSATRLCAAERGLVFRYEAGEFHCVAGQGLTDEARQAFIGSRRQPTPQSGLGRVLATQKPVHIADITDDDAFRQGDPLRMRTAQLLGARTAMWLPLLKDDAVIGALAIYRQEVRPFTEHQVSLVQTFAAQAVISIENVRLFNETKEALEKQTATSDILRSISQAQTDAQPVFEAIARNAVRLCGAAYGGVYQFDGELIHVVANDGYTPEELRVWRSTFPRNIRQGGMIGRAIRLAEPVVVRDYVVENWPELSPEGRASLLARGARSGLHVPMFRVDKVIGAISLVHKDPAAFTGTHVELLRTFADQAVIAIENVRLFNETKEALERQTATAEILKVIASSPDNVQPVFDAIVQSAGRLAAPCSATISMLEGGMLHLNATCVGTGSSADIFDRVSPMYPLPFDPERSPTARAISERRTITISDAQAPDAPEYSRKAGLTGGFRSAIYMPLVRGEEGIGAFILTHPEPGFRLSDNQVTLLQTFASQAVIAIENVRLFNETKESLERQTATAEILKVIASSPSDVQPVFESIADSAMRLLNGWGTVVFRFDGKLLDVAAVRGGLPDTEQHLRKLFPLPPGPDTASTRCIESKSVLQIPDTLEDSSPKVREINLTRGVRSVLSVPMLRDGVPLGVINVARAEAGAFADSEIELLQTFADQAVIAIENVRLFNETKESLERQTATAEILRVISSSPTDTQPVFEAIAQSGLRLFPSAAVAVALPVDNKVHAAAIATHDAAIAAAWRGRFPDPLTRDRMHGTAILDARLVDVPDAEAELNGPWGPGVKNFLASGNRAITIMPMMRGEAAIGAISVIRLTPGPLTENQVALLRTFADQAVIAIENVRLFNETKEALERQTATAEILKVIASSPSDVQPVFDAIGRSAMKLVDGLSAAVGRVVDGMFHLVSITSTSPDGDEVLRRLFPRPVADASGFGKVFETNQPDIVADIETEPHIPPAVLEMARARGWRGRIMVPMVRGQEVIGAISVTRREAGSFAPHHIELLKTFADQAAIAIENVRLFNETKEALERQTATAEILNVISRSHTETAPVFEAIARAALRVFDGLGVVISLVEGDSARVVALVGDVREDEARRPRVMPLDRNSVAARAIVDRAVVNIGDTEAPDAPKITRATGRQLGFRAMAAAPIMAQGEAIGSVGVTRRNPAAFDQNQLGLLQTFADQAAIAIENVRLFKELQSRTDALTKSVGQLTALGEVGQAISSTLDLEKVLQTIVSRAVQLAGLDGGSIYEYDERTEVFTLQAAKNVSREIAEDLRRAPVRKGEGALGRSAITLEPTQIPDTLDDGYHSGRKDLLIRSGYRALLAVPLLREGRLLGGLLVNRKTPGPFAPEIVELLKTFASQSALAIQNARLFREIEAKSSELEVASRHKSEFLANMSHELRTPLNAIIGFSEVLSERMFGELNEKQADYMKDIHASGQHLLSLINDILDLSKIEAGRMDLEVSHFDLPGAISNAMTLVRERAQRQRVTLGLEVDPSLGDFVADERKVKQILLNLLSNAVKFTPEGGRVNVTAALNGRAVQIAVKDTGIGIAPEDHAAVFEEFKQVGRDYTRKAEGTGLGLALTKRFVELHGGEIRLESSPGAGSTFTFTLPVRP